MALSLETILWTDEAISIRQSDAHPLKSTISLKWVSAGKITSFSDIQPWNAHDPILLTDEGIRIRQDDLCAGSCQFLLNNRMIKMPPVSVASGSQESLSLKILIKSAISARWLQFISKKLEKLFRLRFSLQFENLLKPRHFIQFTTDYFPGRSRWNFIREGRLEHDPFNDFRDLSPLLQISLPHSAKIRRDQALQQERAEIWPFWCLEHPESFSCYQFCFQFRVRKRRAPLFFIL